jgi:hypothetical protein
MAGRSPYSIVVSYREDAQAFSVRAVEVAEVAPIVADKLEMPILLEDFEYKLDDEFARRLGVAMLNLIALRQPEIKQFMSVTQQPSN